MTKEATFLSLEARWRSLRDSICREVMFFDTSCAGHRRCRSSGGPFLLLCGWCDKRNSVQEAVSPETKQVYTAVSWEHAADNF